MANTPLLTLDMSGESDRTGVPLRRASRIPDLPVESVGQDLCRASQRAGKELSDVFLVLKIKPDHLFAIEEGRFEALPGRVYAIGHVRSYAAYLGLDAGKFVERLKVELATCGGPRDYGADFLPPAERM